ncbi:MAG: class I adenylate-forming enzyme family protein [Hylemonella sp.]
MLLSLLNYASAKKYYAHGIWRSETLFDLVQQNKSPGFALRDSRHRLTWNELQRWVESVSEQLHQAGLKRGDRVAIWLPSRCESVVTFLACARNGYVACTSLHQNYSSAEILSLVRHSRAAALVMLPGYGALKDVDAFCTQAQEVETLKLMLTVTPSPSSLAADYAAADSQAIPSIPAANDPDAIVYLAFTSGTTGAPKGVMHSHNTLLANGRAMVQEWKYPANTVLLSLSPMSHHIGTVAVEQWLAGGFELVLNDLPQHTSTLDWIHQTGATYLMGVPTHAMDILSAMKQRGDTGLGKVAIFYMAGSPIPVEVAESFLKIGITPQNIYGMTENGSHQYTSPDDDARTIVQTCGRAAAGFETKIVDQLDPNKDVPEGEVGEIATRGGLLMLGYYNNQSATEDSFNREGWFLSGDLGTLDEHRCLRIVGRKKDLIIRGGHNIYPARIEELGYRHPAVFKCAAFGVPDARLGEKVCMALMLRDGFLIEPNEFLQHLYREGLSKYDMPEYFTVMPAFPLTPSGKILKREIQAMNRAGKLSLTAIRFQEPA